MPVYSLGIQNCEPFAFWLKTGRPSIWYCSPTNSFVAIINLSMRVMIMKTVATPTLKKLGDDVSNTQ